MNSAIGPYKGGLRFHPSVNLGILKFLAFEQVFKNSLTTLPMGGGKGGSDFDPKGKIDTEVMRFCQSFMSELFRHIGPDTDVPAGDIGVGGREIGFLFGQYKRLRNEFTGVLTGKGLNWGGSLIRPEATGYGAVYFAAEMLTTRKEDTEGEDAASSPGAATSPSTPSKRSIHFGGKAVTLSDSYGYIYDEEGIDAKKLQYVMDLKNVRRGRIAGVRRRSSRRRSSSRSTTSSGHNPLWNHKAECAFPSATQNEINGKDAENLLKNGVLRASPKARTCRPRSTASRQFLDAQDPLRPGQGGERRRRGHVGAGDGAEQQRLAWPREEGGRAPARDHEEHPQGLRHHGRALRDAGQLRQRRQHRRLPEGRRCDDGPGPRLSAGAFDGASSVDDMR